MINLNKVDLPRKLLKLYKKQRIERGFCDLDIEEADVCICNYLGDIFDELIKRHFVSPVDSAELVKEYARLLNAFRSYRDDGGFELVHSAFNELANILPEIW